MASIHDLAEADLVAIFSQLSLEERHRSVPFVCRSWWQLLCSVPQLAPRSMAVSFDGTQRGASRLRAFCAWLVARGAGTIQHLSLKFGRGLSMPPQLRAQPEADVTAALAACGTAGSLTALQLDGLAGTPAIWAGSMRSLRRLEIVVQRAHHDLQPWDPPVQSLAGLQELSLYGSMDLGPSIPLPACLTKLHLNYRGQFDDVALPRKLTALTRLHTLELDSPEDGLEALGELTTLRRLSLHHSEAPGCISQLTCLESLVLFDVCVEQEDEAEAHLVSVVAPLVHLQKLTHLAFSPDW
ncbi:hypothetical protein ABPG75_012308 [Micractinium tetrahymenae]